MKRSIIRLGSVLRVLLIAILGFTAIMVLTTIALVIADSVSPGIAGPLTINRGAVSLRTPGSAPAFVALLLFALALVAGALLPLIAMLRSAAQGDPFTPANVRRLHVIAGVIGLAYVAQTALPWILPAALDRAIQPMGSGGIFALLLTLVLAEIFREGARLRDDADLTV